MAEYEVFVNISNVVGLSNATEKTTFGVLKNNFARMTSHMDKQVALGQDDTDIIKHSVSFKELTSDWVDNKIINFIKPPAPLV